MALEEITSNKIYLSIVQGTITQKVTEDTPNAKKRAYEKANGEMSEKWELQFKNVSGKITNLQFKESPFGEQFVIQLQDVDEVYVLQFPVDSKYFTDFGKKISNIDLSGEVVLSPFDFEVEGNRKTGITIYQEGTKIDNYFWNAETRESLYGFPQPKENGKGYDSDDWKMYFIEVKKFLKAHVKGISTVNVLDTPFETTTDINEEDHDDLPF